MDWASFTFGAFIACAVLFGTSALVLAPFIRRQFLLWVVARALAVGFLVMTFEPAGSFLFPSERDHLLARLAATDLSIAVVGPLLASYIERKLPLKGLRRMLWAMLPMGCLLLGLGPWIAYAGRFDWLHDFVVLVMVCMLLVGLGGAIWAGSRAARIQAAAWAPAIGVGFVALFHELVLLQPTPFYAEAMLAAFSVEFVVTTGGIGYGFMAIRRERDRALANMREARIANSTDPLTGIANRRGLERYFGGSPRGKPDGIALIDCDRFKRINDRFGHDMGDKVLIAVARGLKAEGVFEARLGGEEFVVLLYGEDWQNMAESARRRITQAVRDHVPELPFAVTASAGLAAVQEEDTLGSAMKRADRALYAAKEAGRNRSLSLTEFRPHADALAEVATA